MITFVLSFVNDVLLADTRQTLTLIDVCLIFCSYRGEVYFRHDVGGGGAGEEEVAQKSCAPKILFLSLKGLCLSLKDSFEHQ